MKLNQARCLILYSYNGVKITAVFINVYTGVYKLYLYVYEYNVMKVFLELGASSHKKHFLFFS